MKRHPLLLLLLWAAVLTLRAIPARPVPFSVVQPDGTSLTLLLHGDEHFALRTTTDGIPVVQAHGGGYYYAVLQADTLAPSAVMAHDASLRLPPEQRFAVEQRESMAPRIAEICAAKTKNSSVLPEKLFHRERKSAAPGSAAPISGQKKALVILVSFKDVAMSTESPQAAFNEQFNQPGYSKNGHIGSVRDYFLAQSYGQLDIAFDVVGPVTLSQTCGYYGSTWGSSSDRYPATMVAEACQQAQQWVDFSRYDWDGDGEVEQVFVVYAGYGEANGAPTYTIWPHMSKLSAREKADDGPGALTIDGVRIDTYACSCELAGSSGTLMAGIGTACHEFSHCLGLPDLYDTTYSGGFGMNAWDVMGSGGHSGPGQNGEVPCGYSAYERWCAGWLTPVELDGEARSISLPCLEDEPAACIIRHDTSPNEFIMLENRQSRGWFSYVGATTGLHGMLVTHVDYDADAWQRNTVNALPQHQRVGIVPADTDYGRTVSSNGVASHRPTADDLAGDLFPGLYGVEQLTPTSHAAAGGSFFSPNSAQNRRLNFTLSGIAEADGTVAFGFTPTPPLATPQMLPPQEVEAQGFTACWNEVEGAESYTVELRDAANAGTPFSHIVLSEDFLRFATAAETETATDLSPLLDAYMQAPGWQGRGIYAAPAGARVAGSGEGGYLLSPTLMTASGSITLRCRLSATHEAESYVRATLISLSGDTLLFQTLRAQPEAQSLTVNFDGLHQAACRLALSGTDAFCLSSLTAYDGHYTADDFAFPGLGGGSAQPVTVEGITQTSHTFGALTATSYRYRVKAVGHGTDSEWSPYTEVQLAPSSAARSLTTSAPTPAAFFTLDGRRVARPQSPGLYIRQQAGRTQKVWLR